MKSDCCRAKTGVVDTRERFDGLTRRRRECSKCDGRFTTVELDIRRLEELEALESMVGWIAKRVKEAGPPAVDWAAERRNTLQKETLEAVRLLTIRNNQPPVAKDVAEVLGAHYHAVCHRLRDMEEAGLIRRIKTWSGKRIYITEGEE